MEHVLPHAAGLLDAMLQAETSDALCQLLGPTCRTGHWAGSVGRALKFGWYQEAVRSSTRLNLRLPRH